MSFESICSLFALQGRAIPVEKKLVEGEGRAVINVACVSVTILFFKGEVSVFDEIAIQVMFVTVRDFNLRKFADL